jgi:hypothetical protein
MGSESTVTRRVDNLPDFQNPQHETGERRLLLIFLLTFIALILLQPLLKKYRAQSPVPKPETQTETAPVRTVPSASPVTRSQRVTPPFSHGKQAASETVPDIFPQIVNFIQQLAETWGVSISSPRSLLEPQFVPDTAEIAAGLQFYLIMLSISSFFYIAIALGQAGEFGTKVRLVANGLFGLLTSGIMAMAWYLPFRWFGGRANLGATYLAMAYGSGPYIPIGTLCTMLGIAGLPERFRAYAVNPATAQRAYQLAANDPDTASGTLLSGCLLTALVSFASSIMTLYCMTYVHDLHSWRLVGAVLVSSVLFIPVSVFLRKIATVFAI